MNIAVIIPVYNRPDLINMVIHDLNALEQPEIPIHFTVVVVDDGSTQDIGPQLAECRWPLQCVRVPHNQGPAAARNRGLSASQSDYAAFLDSDVRVLPGWLEAMVQAIQRYPEADIFEGITQPATSPHPVETRPFAHVVVNYGKRFLTSNIVYRRSALEEVGGFDEAFRLPNREDSDVALTLLERGCHAVTVGDMVVIHPIVARSLRQRLSESQHCLFEARFLSKHKAYFSQLDPAVVRNLGRAVSRWEWGVLVGTVAAAILAGSGGWEAAALIEGIVLAVAWLRVMQAERGTVRRIHWVAWLVYAGLDPWFRSFWLVRGFWRTYRNLW